MRLWSLALPSSCVACAAVAATATATEAGGGCAFLANRSPRPGSRRRSRTFLSSASAAPVEKEAVVRSRPSSDTDDDDDDDVSDILPPPPCPKSNPSDDFYRTLRSNLPVSVQNYLRDSGALRAVVDGLVYVGLPGVLNEHPNAARDFFRLTFSRSLSGTNPVGTFADLKYGDHPMQVVHLFEPPPKPSLSSSFEEPPAGLVVFCHGGAWGSGRPWMYRLAALPFLEEGMAVGIVGYRTYPDADVDGQVSDLNDAIEFLTRERPDLTWREEEDGGLRGVTLVGHSSGAHIGMLLVLKRAEERMARARAARRRQTELEPTTEDDVGIAAPLVSTFVGMSGIYCIPSHYEYESGRGVEEFSPMKAACGSSVETFLESSPSHRIRCRTTDPRSGAEVCALVDEEVDDDDIDGEEGVPSREPGATSSSLGECMPRMLFLHGVDDDTVPYTSTVAVVEALRSSSDDGMNDKVEEMLLRDVGHSDTVLHLMMGGPTKDALRDWLVEKK